jgi:DNA-directed RNA polymerase specialized sigma24 family protein
VLSVFEYSVFSGLLRGDSQAEIAAQNGVELKAVRNAVQRIRTKLK